MRKRIVLLIRTAALVLAALPASAESYKFPQVFMVMEVPADYTAQITTSNMNAYEEYLSSIGETPDSMKQRFRDEGIML